MAYFPHAYQKTFLALGAVNASGTTTASLNKGDFAVCNASTYTSLAAGAIAGVPQVIFAQGSLHDVDKLGPFHGGYQESVKSKGINPKYVSAAWKSVSSAETVAVLTVEAEGDCFACGAERYLRVDVKGSPALRFLGRNAYFVADWTEKCCIDGQSFVDPYVVLSTWADQVNGDPLVSPFVSAVVEMWDTNTSAWVSSAGHVATTQGHGKFRIVLTAATTSAVSTHFGDAGFRPTDHYELEPITLVASEVDETGNPCNVICTTIDNGLPAGIQPRNAIAGTQKTGTGESVIRQLILNNRYDQDPFQQDSRMREILNETAFNVDRTASYDLFYVLHSVPRKSNPSGTMDNDQYLLCVAAEAGGPAVADVEALITALAVEAGVDDINNPGFLYVK